jgi:acyl-CoA reductase-like NAD-dependent aldehyde dehydrogenase
MTITPFKSIDEAVTLANSTGYGLSASVFTRNKALGREIASRLNAGSVVINDVLTGYGIADLPFGGKGLSGFGRLHGEEGLKAFCNIKSITENRINLSNELWWYGMSRKIEKPLKKIIRFYYGR